MITVYVVVVVVVVEDHGKTNFFYLTHPVAEGGGVTPHSEIIVGHEPPCIFGTTLLRKPHSEIIVGHEPPCILGTTLLGKEGHTPF